MMIESRIYKGIEYVQLSELPGDQQDLISHSSDNREMIIKIQVDGKILNDCIQFKDYLNWYKRQFNIKTSHANDGLGSESNIPVSKSAEKFVTEKI